MKALTTVFLLTALFGSITSSSAQDNISIEFGKVTLKDFDVKPPSTDSAANAIIVADWGKTEVVGHTNSTSYYNAFNPERRSDYVNTTLVKFSRKIRIKIVNKKGFDAATVYIYLTNRGGVDSEKVEGLNASTYNLKGRRVVRTKLEVSSLVPEYNSTLSSIIKLNFKAVKEGSILEYSYTTTKCNLLSNLYPWYFQGKYPCLWSEYSVSIPDLFTYNIIPQGQPVFFINTTNQSHGFFEYYTEDGYQNYEKGTLDRVSSYGKQFNIPIIKENYRWVMKDVPALKAELLKITANNNIALQFRLVANKLP